MDSCESSDQSSDNHWAQIGSIFKKNFKHDLTIYLAGGTRSIASHQSLFHLKSKELRRVLLEGVKDNVLRLPEVEPKAFQLFHDFMYENEFPENAVFSDEEVITILQLGKKYWPENIGEISTKLMAGRIMLTNVFKLNQVSKTLKLSALEEITSKYINDFNLNPDFKRKDFLEMSASNLSEMLQSDCLQCSVMGLFEAIISWGQNQVYSPAMTLRDKLEPIFDHIGFHLMTFADIVQVRKTGVLTDEEFLALYDYVGTPVDERPESFKFSKVPRVPAIISQSLSQEEEHNTGIAGTACGVSIHQSETDMPSLSPIRPHSLVDIHQVAAIQEEMHTTLEINTWNEFLTKIEKTDKSHAVKIEAVLKKFGTRLPPLNTHRLLMPDLKTVNLDLRIPDEQETELTVINLRKHFNPKRFVFFKKDDKIKEHVTVAELLTSKVDIELSVNSCKFFKINREDKEVVIGFGRNDGTTSSLFIEKVIVELETTTNFTKLVIVDNEVPLKALHSHALEEIVLWGLHVKSSSQLMNFLHKCDNLTSLSTWIQGPDRGLDFHDKSCIDIEKDLMQLVRMSLCCLKLLLHPRAEGVRREALTELYTDGCHWSPEIFQNFHTIFPNLRKVSFGHCPLNVYHEFPSNEYITKAHSIKRARLSTPLKKKMVVQLNSAVTIQLMTNIRKLQHIEYILVEKLDSDITPWTKMEKDEILKFIQDAVGLVSSSFPSNFCLTKNTNGKWEGELLNENAKNYSETTKKMMYKDFRLDKVFGTFDAFDYYDVPPKFTDLSPV